MNADSLSLTDLKMYQFACTDVSYCISTQLQWAEAFLSGSLFAIGGCDKVKSMENYYDKIIAEIRTAIDDKKYGEAEYLLQRELKMPYIPEDAETRLRDLSKDLAYAKSEADPVK